MATASDFIMVWSHRLNMNSQGATQWTPSLRCAVETLVKNLKAIEPTEPVELDADLTRSPIMKFIRGKMGKVPGEIDMHPDEATI